MLQNAPKERSAVLLTCIKLPHGFKTFILSIFEWPLKTGFTVLRFSLYLKKIYNDCKIWGIVKEKKSCL